MSGTPAATGELAEAVRTGETRAIARAISLLEEGGPPARALLAALRPGLGSAYTIGVTGPPGAGKSTLIAALVREARRQGRGVAVVSVDPSSPFTHGALLGDRVRLSEHFLDPGVFIRSTGSRGHPGGLAASTLATLLVLGAAGKDVVFVETVGVGQSEIGIVDVADVVVVVLMPGSGDSIQALKSGVMEIPDLIALNKCDLPGAQTAARDLRQVLALGGSVAPQLVLTCARDGEGTAQLWAALQRKGESSLGDDRLARSRGERLVAGVLAEAAVRARGYLEQAVRSDPDLGAMLERVRTGELDPLSAVEEITNRLFP